MIIQIRGTSGSGKSTVMRRVMEELAQPFGDEGWITHWNPVLVEGRKKPLYYQRGAIYVLGHYESNCGGCDTIGSAAQVFELIQQVQRFKASIVLCEGLLLSEDVKWSSQLEDLRVIFLATPIDTCISQIKQRRASVGNDKPLSESNTRNRVATIERARSKLTEAGVFCRRASSDQAVKLVLDWLKS